MTSTPALSTAAERAIAREREVGGVRVSAISVWELFMLVKKGRLELTVSASTLLRRAERLSYIQFVPVDNHIARSSVELPDLHRDPADRIILSTAAVLGCPVVSKDQRFREYPEIQVIW